MFFARSSSGLFTSEKVNCNFFELFWYPLLIATLMLTLNPRCFFFFFFFFLYISYSHLDLRARQSRKFKLKPEQNKIHTITCAPDEDFDRPVDSLRCPWLFIKRIAKTVIGLHGRAGLSESSLLRMKFCRVCYDLAHFQFIILLHSGNICV